VTTFVLFAIAVVAVVGGVALFHLFPALKTYFAYRGKRIITCPETHQKAAVEVAAGTAAATVLWGDPRLRLDRCSRWPERQTCGQECLQQIEADPENCLLWNIVSNWYQGKKCFFCHKPFARMQHLDHPPALLGPDRRTTEWKQFQPEEIFKILAKYQPVCWNCHIVETFRRVHPELVVERHRDIHTKV